MWIVVLIVVLAVALGIVGQLLEVALWLTSLLIIALIAFGAFLYGAIRRRIG